MKGRQRGWVTAVLLLLLAVAGAARLVMQWTDARMRRENAPRLLRVWKACDRAVQAERGPSWHLAPSPGADWRAERQAAGVHWSLSGPLRESDYEMYCEAVEQGQTLRVTSVESPAWWTPPPS